VGFAVQVWREHALCLKEESVRAKMCAATATAKGLEAERIFLEVNIELLRFLLQVIFGPFGREGPEEEEEEEDDPRMDGRWRKDAPLDSRGSTETLTLSPKP
jgi:hypothetical protein